MRTWHYFLCSLFFITILFSGCKKNSESTDPVNQSLIKAAEGDYLPAKPNQTVTGTLNASISTYDSLNTLTSSQVVQGREVKGLFGEVTTVKNMNVLPVLGYSSEYKRNILVGYLFNNNGELQGVNKSSNPVNGLILPKEFAIGQEWVVNSIKSKVPAVKVKAAEALTNYVTSVGHSYSDVVRLEVSFVDSSYYQLITFLGSVYLAKGKGIVEADIDNCTVNSYFHSYWDPANEGKIYKKTVIKATVGL